MAKNNKKQNGMAFLVQANKETRTLSGTIKIVSTFWANGYNKAFAEYIPSKKECTFDYIQKHLQKNEEGKIFVVVKKAKKDAKGEIIKVQGKTQYEVSEKVVERWSPNRLFEVFKQTNEE